MNQNVNYNEIRKFYSEIRVDEVHSRINYVLPDRLDKTHAQWSNAIDSVVALEGLIEFVKGSMIVSNQEIINTDHSAYVIDVKLEEYFNEEFSHWDKMKQKAKKIGTIKH